MVPEDLNEALALQPRGKNALLWWRRSAQMLTVLPFQQEEVALAGVSLTGPPPMGVLLMRPVATLLALPMGVTAPMPEAEVVATALMIVS